MLLFVYKGTREIFGDAQEIISLRLKKQTQSAFVTIFTLMKKEMIDRFL